MSCSIACQSKQKSHALFPAALKVSVIDSDELLNTDYAIFFKYLNCSKENIGHMECIPKITAVSSCTTVIVRVHINMARVLHYRHSLLNLNFNFEEGSASEYHYRALRWKKVATVVAILPPTGIL